MIKRQPVPSVIHLTRNHSTVMTRAVQVRFLHPLPGDEVSFFILASFDLVYSTFEATRLFTWQAVCRMGEFLYSVLLTPCLSRILDLHRRPSRPSFSLARLNLIFHRLVVLLPDLRLEIEVHQLQKSAQPALPRSPPALTSPLSAVHSPFVSR